MRGSNRSQILRWSYLACHLDLLKEKKHAQQDSHTDSETTENIESLGNGSSSDRSQDLNLDQIKSMLASIDPIILKQLLVEILQEWGG